MASSWSDFFYMLQVVVPPCIVALFGWKGIKSQSESNKYKIESAQKHESMRMKLELYKERFMSLSESHVQMAASCGSILGSASADVFGDNKKAEYIFTQFIDVISRSVKHDLEQLVNENDNEFSITEGDREACYSWIDKIDSVLQTDSMLEEKALVLYEAHLIVTKIANSLISKSMERLVNRYL